ncbi:MAG: hypothetical protein H0W33_13145 [Gammaproteobacteria bacterium]|nr:hypothetical protein [Gammaproteobacteria bacterium]
MSSGSGEFYLAIDQGGHASRAMVFDRAGAVIAAAFSPLATRYPQDGWVEHDAEALLASVRAAVNDALSAVDDSACIRAAGLATQRSSIVCWDRGTGEPLSPVISWQDRRNADWLRQQDLDPAALRDVTGLVVSPHYGASKLRWCLDHLVSVRCAREQNTLAAGPVASFVLSQLLEERPFVVDPANASRTLLWDHRSRDWSTSLLKQFGIPRSMLPDCVGNRYAYGHLPFGDGHIPLEICTGDQSAVPFAFGPPREDAAYVNIGTGAFIQRLIDHPPGSTHGLLVSVSWQHGTEATYALEGTVNGAGSALAAIGEELGVDPESAFGEPVGPAQPLFLNGIGGLGSPFWLPKFKSRFVGEGEPAARLRAVLESIAFLLQENLEPMAKLGGPLDALIMTGGLAAHDELCQTVADLSGLRVLRPTVREATARGLAWLIAGRPPDWHAAVQRFEPAPDTNIGRRFTRWREAMRSAGA